MATHRLPARPNLEQLRNRAKDLLKAYCAGHTAALARFRESLPHLSRIDDTRLVQLDLSLRDAQQVVASEHGFSSWVSMRNHIERQEIAFMFEMTVDGVKMSEASDHRVVILRSEKTNQYLPIWIGRSEGDQIALKLQGMELPRPMTHDLMDSMVRDLGATVGSVVISELRGDTYVAKLVLQSNGTTLEQDCRPSDAIALAVRCDARILAEPDVLDKAGVEFDPATGEPVASEHKWLQLTDMEIMASLGTGPATTVHSEDAFSKPVGWLLYQAGVEARRAERSEVELEDILRAIVSEPDGSVARELAGFGLDIQAIASGLENR